MNKKFHFIIFSIMCISVLLLGLSFAKESGIKSDKFLNEKISNEFRVIYNNDNFVDTIKNSELTFSIINKKSDKINYYLILKEVDGLKYEDVFYQLNSQEKKKLVDGIIQLGSLEGFGNTGDQGTYEIILSSESNKLYNFEALLSIKDIGKLNEVIINSEGVYTDTLNNVRYFGSNPNNYIKYDGSLYRIVGLINGKVKIIGEVENLSVYYDDNDFLTLSDYLGSFNNSIVNIYNSNNYESWIKNTGYWLKDVNMNKAYSASFSYGVVLSDKTSNYYIRHVYELEPSFVVIGGNGSENSPYEVSYGS